MSQGPPLGRQHSRRAAFGAMAGVVGLLAAACAAPGQQPRRPVATPKPTATPDTGPALLTFQASGNVRKPDNLVMPLRLAIPRIGVDAPVIAVGLTPEGAMDVPKRAGDVGWYEYSPRPGLPGNAVLAGHLDWQGVTGVFNRLLELRPGDAVAIRTGDGQDRGYRVQWHEEYQVNSAPVERIFEAWPSPALTLITCGGRWNPATRRYDTRVVIRALRV